MKIGIVNSSTFGMYTPDLMKKLGRIGDIERIRVDKNIKGEELAEKTKGIRFIIASVTPKYDEEFFKLNKETVLICRHGLGYNNIDIEAATRYGVMVTRVPGRDERDSVAELAVTLILNCLRKTISANQAVRKGKWKERAKFVGWELRKKSVGIIGYGNIGKRVGEILKNGFEVDILVYDPNILPENIKEKGVNLVTFEELLRKSDIITLHASLTSENYHLLGAKEFALMKKGVIIVNAARGELIEEKELVKALESGKVRAVGLDVIENEPIENSNPLLSFENVYIVPHIAAYTREAMRRMDEKMVEDIEKVIKGEVPSEIINPRVTQSSQARSRNLQVA